ncbi:hydroxyphenylacetyl-CoA thioesterase PaaI [Nocardioides sp. zg-1228]|uniref:hydroxyphenylacetyl-CoA thioesterase PaaI n=1 Tax=Nocardioides sp. zg-1228 TaxID=2763008 RepID=UPI001643030F|nr:hydroxyphenylacetyl-CoA thioesterase PaaI [Nocardioides sp. zg-1228]MBC2934003.1 hydroxyphenylacetyl-CoA thioesterase PaaI [Nocardioides sp. zg-1228]QSF58759.1 hydroxyphenylacetyl-CoA thioesterase PaaI [Nocardioides sp. zg-1228]
MPDPAREMWAADAASAMLGMRLADVGDGAARVSMVVRPDMVNGHDLCHGGLVASLADSAFALACNSRGPVTVAAGFSVDLLAPARLGQTLHAGAREVWLRGRSGLYDVTVRADDPDAGEVIAQFRGRSRVLSRG